MSKTYILLFMLFQSCFVNAQVYDRPPKTLEDIGSVQSIIPEEGKIQAVLNSFIMAIKKGDKERLKSVMYNKECFIALEKEMDLFSSSNKKMDYVACFKKIEIYDLQYPSEKLNTQDSISAIVKIRIGREVSYTTNSIKLNKRNDFWYIKSANGLLGKMAEKAKYISKGKIK